MKRAVLYARFSPRPNASDCESCEHQLADLREYCKRRKIEVVGEFSDKALSGSDDLEDRPGMFDAAAAAKRGYLFVVRAFDRLFRDTRKGLIFATEMERKGVQVVSITEEAASLNTPEAQLMRTIFLAIAEYQRQIIRARTRAKMRQHQANGRRMSSAENVPYGWAVDPADPHRMVKNHEEIATVDTIKQAYKEGDSLRAICRLLNDRGLRNRKGRPFAPQTIKRILQREGVYQGGEPLNTG